MTQYEKLLEKFLLNPTSITLKDLIKILENNWYEYRAWKWSHNLYTNEKWNRIVIAVHNNDCKKSYKKEVKKILFPNK